MIKALSSFLAVSALASDELSVLQYQDSRSGNDQREAPLNVFLSLDSRGNNVSQGQDETEIEAEFYDDLQGTSADGLRKVLRLHNNQDMDYTAGIQVGGQNLRCVMDTGSFELVVFTDRCKSKSCKKNHRLYKPSKSRTLRELQWEKDLVYGSGDVKAKMMEDNVAFGLGNTSISFWAVVDADLPVLEEGSFECIFGLSHPKEPLLEVQERIKLDRNELGLCADDHKCRNRIHDSIEADRDFAKIMMQKRLPLEDHHVQRFSICLQKAYGHPGVLVWNDWAPGDRFVGVRVNGHMHWSAPLADFHIEGKRPFCVTGCSGLLDSGTSLLAAPTEIVHQLSTMLKLSRKSCQSINRYPRLHFMLDGHNFSLPPSAYLGMSDGVPDKFKEYFSDEIHGEYMKSQGPDKGPKCMMTIMNVDIKSHEGYPQFILGMPLFREYYTTFEMWPDSQHVEVTPGANMTVEKAEAELQWYENRTMHLAPASDNCMHPSRGGQLFEHQESSMARTVDWSKVRVPGWLERARRSGRAPQ